MGVDWRPPSWDLGGQRDLQGGAKDMRSIPPAGTIEFNKLNSVLSQLLAGPNKGG